MFKLIDAIEQNKKTPETFEIPSTFEIMSIHEGDFVQLCFIEKGLNPERIWVEVLGINNGRFTGKVDNVPFHLKTVRFCDTVFFESRHILKTLGASVK